MGRLPEPVLSVTSLLLYMARRHLYSTIYNILQAYRTSYLSPVQPHLALDHNLARGPPVYTCALKLLHSGPHTLEGLEEALVPPDPPRAAGLHVHWLVPIDVDHGVPHVQKVGGPGGQEIKQGPVSPRQRWNSERGNAMGSMITNLKCG